MSKRLKDSVNATFHLHPMEGVAVSALEDGLMIVDQTACALYNNVAYHGFEGLAVEAEEGPAIAEGLGEKFAMIMSNHGLMTVGRTVEEAVGWFVMAERVAEVHVKAPNGKAISDGAAAVAAATMSTDLTGWRVFQWLRRSVLDG